MSFFLTEKAKSDLKDIAQYTQSEWGVEQRNLYLKQLDDAFQRLNKAQNLGLKCDYIRVGYRKHQVGRHFVFYRPVNDGKDIEIVRVLHERMNVEIHLSDGD